MALGRAAPGEPQIGSEMVSDTVRDRPGATIVVLSTAVIDADPAWAVLLDLRVGPVAIDTVRRGPTANHWADGRC
jgi:hypothetical protein